MLLLTNCTFDGHVSNVERIMHECLAIKPDMVFLWDEAWFGFAASRRSSACARPWVRGEAARDDARSRVPQAV